MNAALRQQFAACFPFIEQASAGFVEEFFGHAREALLEADTPICDEGQQCAHLALVLEGVGRVFKLSPNGREITLYRIYPGQSCVLTASCIMSRNAFPAMAVSETPVQALLVPPERVRSWFCQETAWRDFVFGLLSHRLGDIIAVVEEVAFKRIDLRLAEQMMRALERGERVLHKTHQELAADVGSSREVVSRILREFSERGLIRSRRGEIEILDAAAIRRWVAQPG
jgi:CRP/FNR family transcriptional regulator